MRSAIKDGTLTIDDAFPMEQPEGPKGAAGLAARLAKAEQPADDPPAPVPAQAAAVTTKAAKGAKAKAEPPARRRRHHDRRCQAVPRIDWRRKRP
jgi:hypothetical protein